MKRIAVVAALAALSASAVTVVDQSGMYSREAYGRVYAEKLRDFERHNSYEAWSNTLAKAAAVRNAEVAKIQGKVERQLAAGYSMGVTTKKQKALQSIAARRVLVSVDTETKPGFVIKRWKSNGADVWQTNEVRRITGKTMTNKYLTEVNGLKAAVDEWKAKSSEWQAKAAEFQLGVAEWKSKFEGSEAKATAARAAVQAKRDEAQSKYDSASAIDVRKAVYRLEITAYDAILDKLDGK